MDNTKKTIQRKFYLLSAVFPLIVVSFFLYAQFTDSWGKKFQDISVWHTVIQVGYAIITFLYLYFYYRFVRRHKSIFEKRKK